MPTIEAETVPTFMLTQTRVIRAPRQRVYEAWTNPEGVKQWFGRPGRSCPNAQLDVRVGGAYRIESMPDDSGAAGDSGCKAKAAIGTYTKIVPNELLQFTWSSDWNPDENSLVTVSLKEVEGGTEITILHENFNNEASRDAHSEGWAGCLGNLAAMLED
ncbi:MAG TPA: SRPBCC domain-containing protein [Acidobacteriaceae bacterium]|jgi:uncharacterized protein YndB with AHSA1/START domain